MRTIIAGGRDYSLSACDFWALDLLPITVVICGKARGADTDGEIWARSRNIPVEEFPADWDNYGRRAGPIRNELMAQVAQAVVLFPGGVGTASMHGLSKRYKLQIHDWRN
ncbi:MAG: DUF2493 domain-containing protein [Okeania sp. SIO3H1]|nr:DUF2493 domain-containing protein [Okeania sp. SIO3H1]